MFILLAAAVAMHLGQTTAQAAPTPPSAPADPVAQLVDPGSKIQCRKSEVTGSRARFIKECRTVAEWRRLDRAASEFAKRMQEGTGMTQCDAAPSRGC